MNKQEKAKKDWQDAINRFCQIYTEKYNLKRQINPMDFAIGQTLAEMEEDIEDEAKRLSALEKAKAETAKANLLQSAGDEVPRDIKYTGMDISVEEFGTASKEAWQTLKTDIQSPAFWGDDTPRTYTLDVEINAQQRVEMQQYFRTAGIKFKLKQDEQ